MIKWPSQVHFLVKNQSSQLLFSMDASLNSRFTFNSFNWHENECVIKVLHYMPRMLAVMVRSLCAKPLHGKFYTWTHSSDVNAAKSFVGCIVHYRVKVKYSLCHPRPSTMYNDLSSYNLLCVDYVMNMRKQFNAYCLVVLLWPPQVT